MTRRDSTEGGEVPSAVDAADGARPAFPQRGFAISEYTILDMLGHGSMSTVFLASDATDHEVALKVIHETSDVSETILERFRREIQASKELREHPNIVTTYATGRDRDFHYIAMQHVRGRRTLETLIQKGPLPLEDAVAMAAKLARALAYAHRHSIVHRDVKPSNVMINRFGEPLLSDFGVAALMEMPKFTVAGAITGTPLYMSPEQAGGRPLTGASDLYSLGVVLFELVTGELPYRSPRYAPVSETLRAVHREAPRRPRLFRPDLDRDLEAVMMKALAKSPERRYADGDLLAADLENAIAGRRIGARRYSWWDHMEHVAWQHRSAFVYGSIIVAVGLAGAQWSSSQLRTVYDQQLVGLAHLLNTQDTLRRLELAQGGGRSTTGQTQQDRRLAGRLMDAGRWQEAFDRLTPVLEQSLERKDLRTVAIANLDQARCALMLGNDLVALNRYYDILNNPDAPPRVTGQAAVEWAVLTRIRIPQQDLEPILSQYELDDTNPLLLSLRCLRGQIAPQGAVERIHTLPGDAHNDTYLAASVMAHRLGDEKAAADYLRRCLTASRPSTEWPGPFARNLRKVLGL